MIKLTINGEEKKLADRTTISTLLESMQIPLNHVAVEVNRKIVTKANHTEFILSEGDIIEIVQFVGGG